MSPAGEDFVFGCPGCGEHNVLFIDPDERGQTLIVDCRVCCRPVEIVVPLTPGEPPRVHAQDR